jgi:hypothetical protein
MTTLLVSFDQELTPEDRCYLKEALAEGIRLALCVQLPVSIDVLATPVKDLNERGPAQPPRRHEPMPYFDPDDYPLI